MDFLENEHQRLHLQNYGYVVIPQVNIITTCHSWKQLSEKAHGGWKAMKQFSKDYCPAGIWDGVQHHPVLWEIRQNPLLFECFLFMS